MRSLKCYLLPLTEKAFLSGGVIAAAARQIDDVLRFRLAVPQNASPTLRNHLAELYQLYPGLIPESPYFVDFTKLKDIQYACGECDGLIASSSVQNPNFTEESNLFQVAGKQDHFHVLKVSCSDGLLHARQRVAIGAAHWRLEEQLRSSQLSHTILRMNTSMQSFCRGKMRDMVQSRTLSIPIRRGKVAFVDESDVADVIVTLCQQHVTAPWETKELSVTGPEPLTFPQVAELLSNELHQAIRHSYFPLWAMQPALWIRGLRPEEIASEIGMARALENNAEERVTDAIESVLSRKPTTFRDFIRDHKSSWVFSEK